jgi:hypothetical protein
MDKAWVPRHGSPNGDFLKRLTKGFGHDRRATARNGRVSSSQKLVFAVRHEAKTPLIFKRFTADGQRCQEIRAFMAQMDSNGMKPVKNI